MSKSDSKVWFINGASSGFGLLITELALSAGHRVIGSSRSAVPPELQGCNLRWIHLDVTDQDSGNLLDRIVEEEGGIDVLVLCASQAINGVIEELQENEIHQPMEVNYFGPLRLIRAAIPHLRNRRGGTIAWLGTAGVLASFPTLSTYLASKTAMESLCGILRNEVSPFNIRVLNFHIGAFDTPFADRSCRVAQTPINDAYKETMSEMFMTPWKSGSYTGPRGESPTEASNLIYEFITVTGRAVGKEEELVIPIGTSSSMGDTYKTLEQTAKNRFTLWKEINGIQD